MTLPSARIDELLERAAEICERYHRFIMEHVKADDLEMHPYPPEIEGVVDGLRAIPPVKAQAEREGEDAEAVVADDDDRMWKISKLIAELQSVLDRFGDTCVYIRRGGMAWGAVALNRKADDEKNGVFDLQATHDLAMVERLEQIERLKADRNEWRDRAVKAEATLASPLPVEPVDHIADVEPVTVGGSASEEQVEAVARYICAATLHTSWDGLQEGRITERGYKPFAYNNFGGWRFQGGHEDIRDIARKAIAALSTTTAREAGWQPIETAPKDGRNVLLYADGVREYARYVVGHWGKALLTPAQWFDYAGTKPLGLTPTHWRPLPTPPSALHHGGGSQ